MALRNRKQIPLCSNCHLGLVHTGKYDSTKLVKIAPVKTVDNRVLTATNLVKPGKEYNSKSLQERGWRLKGQNKEPEKQVQNTNTTANDKSNT